MVKAKINVITLCSEVIFTHAFNAALGLGGMTVCTRNQRHHTRRIYGKVVRKKKSKVGLSQVIVVVAETIFVSLLPALTNLNVRTSETNYFPYATVRVLRQTSRMVVMSQRGESYPGH